MRAQEFSDTPHILDMAISIGLKYAHLNHLFKAIHDLVAHSEAILLADNADIPVIEDAVNKYLEYYREECGNIVPKLHFFEDHVTDLTVGSRPGKGHGFSRRARW